MILLLLLTLVFGLSASIEPWFQTWAGNRTESANILAVTLGDSRRLFARHVYAKADAYFHNGYYPSIFDYQQQLEGNRLGERIGLEAASSETCAGSHLGPPQDWIDRFSRHFFPSRHVHLGEDLSNHEGHDCDAHCNHGPAHVHGPDCDHDNEPVTPDPHDHDADNPDLHDAHSEHADSATSENHGDPAFGPDAAAPQHGGREAKLEREVLPWLRFSASLDPNKVGTYVVAAYWLRTELEKPDQAEQFLREGLRANPGNPEILFELGRIHAEDRKDAGRARNVWEMALRRWVEREGEKAEPNLFLYAQLLGNLGRLEEEQGNWARAIQHLSQLVPISPHRTKIEEWIAELKAKERGPER